MTTIEKQIADSLAAAAAKIEAIGAEAVFEEIFAAIEDDKSKRAAEMTEQDMADRAEWEAEMAERRAIYESSKI